ncbi:MAG TPA: energy transducer TonB [Candidatus Sulfotelmatobacter sp.]|nr:energy transducer TonB [Candidatus Sulfotelmatobacter sp.]
MLTPLRSSAQDANEHARRVVTRVNPQYPPLARNLNIVGTVRIEVTVGPNGSVKSSQVKGGHPLFAQPAIDAVSQWKWEPAPHETTQVIEVRFNP